MNVHIEKWTFVTLITHNLEVIRVISSCAQISTTDVSLFSAGIQ